MKIAITGATGRVGTEVARQAQEHGYSVVGIDRVAPNSKDMRGKIVGGVEYVVADVDDYAALESAFAGCDAVVHLAAIPSPGHHPDQVVHNNNVVGSYNALIAAVKNGIKRVCQASSVNATGLVFSRAPRFDYFPLDEKHTTYNEDPYSLSKWICEAQADSIARRYEDMSIASMRFHWVVDNEHWVKTEGTKHGDFVAKQLWGYTDIKAAARACLLSLRAPFTGHEAFYICAPDTMMPQLSLELASQYFPSVPIRGNLSGRTSFFDSSKAERLLGWKHNQ